MNEPRIEFELPETPIADVYEPHFRAGERAWAIIRGRLPAAAEKIGTVDRWGFLQKEVKR